MLVTPGANAQESDSELQTEHRRSELMTEFIELMRERIQEYPKDRIIYIKCYRKDNTPEIIYEMKSAKGYEVRPSKEKQDAIRNGFIEQVGTEFSAGKIKEYGEHGIVFTMRGVSHDDKELYNIPIRFDRMLAYFGHPY